MAARTLLIGFARFPAFRYIPRVDVAHEQAFPRMGSASFTEEQGQTMSNASFPRLATSARRGRFHMVASLMVVLQLAAWAGLSPSPAAILAADGAADPQHPLAPALEHAYQAREALMQVADYEATFSKREVVGRRPTASKIRVKLREQPYSVYMQFDNPHKGREVIYVTGKNNGMLLAHEEGIRRVAGTVSLAPDSEDAMEDNRYPITMVGMRNLVSKVIEQWEAEMKYGEVDVKYYPNARLGETDCKVIETQHPQPRKQFKFQMTRLYIDKATGFPVRVEQWAFGETPQSKPTLAEEYTYTNIRANLGLTDRDFDQTNPNYAFPR